MRENDEAVRCQSATRKKTSQSNRLSILLPLSSYRGEAQDIPSSVCERSHTGHHHHIVYRGKALSYYSDCTRETLTIKCNNQQTIRLFVDKAMKLQTKFRHVDIHLHWLRQEVQRKSIGIRWVPTSKMIADGLTKALSTAKHEVFVGMTSLEDQKYYLASIKREEDLKEAIQRRRAN